MRTNSKEETEKIVSLLRTAMIYLSEKNKNIYIKEKNIPMFKNIFESTYFMINRICLMENEEFDRSKKAGIIAFSIISSDVIGNGKKLEKNELFCGQYFVAVSVSLSYLFAELNRDLRKKGLPTVKEIVNPKDNKSDISYVEKMCTSLRIAFQSKFWGISPMEIGNQFYLLEQLTLEKFHIKFDEKMKYQSE